MEFLTIIVIISILIAIIIKLIKNINIIYLSEKSPTLSDKLYSQKNFMTNIEKYFYDIFVTLEQELNIKIHPQINLATIINKNSQNKYRTELFRNIDFAIFDKDYNKILLLIEINDNTHNQKNRIIRDKKVEQILQIANIKLIKFYTKYPNKPEYVINRIKEELKKSN